MLQIVWSHEARGDLRSLIEYIAPRNPIAARRRSHCWMKPFFLQSNTLIFFEPDALLAQERLSFTLITSLVIKWLMAFSSSFAFYIRDSNISNSKFMLYI